MSAFFRGAIVQKITNPLCRSRIVRSACQERAAFQILRQSNAAQRIGTKSCGIDRNSKGSIPIDAVPCVTAHTVSHNGLRFAGGCRHKSTRTHTERKTAALPFAMRDGIFSSPQTRVSGITAKHRRIDIGLLVLNPHANCKAFGDEKNLFAEQCFKRITRTVPGCQNHMSSRNFTRICADRCDTVILYAKITHTGLEENLSAQITDFFAKRPYHIL